MSARPTVYDFISPSSLVLPISSEINTCAWENNQSLSNPTSRYQGYLNELCLQAVLSWLHEEIAPQAKISFCTTALPSFWELVNGTVISIDDIRLVLVPQESIDCAELRIPQEWVDIPGWAGNYYLGVQVNPDSQYIVLWGYSTHAAIKNRGTYDPYTRTYSLKDTDTINDIGVFAAAWELCKGEPTTSEITPLAPLSSTQAHNLLERLANPTIVSPRLQIPFTMWGGLVGNDGWRKSLYQRRLGLGEQFSIWEWLQTGVSPLASQFGWGKFATQTAFAGSRSLDSSSSTSILSRTLTIAGQNYELRIVPQTHNGETTWRFELRNALIDAAIPGGFTLRLLTEDLQPFPNNEDTAIAATDVLFVEVALETNEGIVWEIEPLPESYEREILRF